MTTTCRFKPALMVDAGVAVWRLAFASCYVYSPNGMGAESERSRVLRELLKAGDARVLFHYADRVRRELATDPAFAGLLGPSSVLVPIPGSAPTGPADRLVADRLAAALIAEGMGANIWRGLRRVWRVRKSATAPPGSRPTVADHYESFAIDPDVAPPLSGCFGRRRGDERSNAVGRSGAIARSLPDD